MRDLSIWCCELIAFCKNFLVGYNSDFSSCITVLGMSVKFSLGACCNHFGTVKSTRPVDAVCAIKHQNNTAHTPITVSILSDFTKHNCITILPKSFSIKHYIICLNFGLLNRIVVDVAKKKKIYIRYSSFFKRFATSFKIYLVATHNYTVLSENYS